MASPYKMKNSMLKMASKGAPMQKNYAGSPMHNDKKALTDAQIKKGDKTLKSIDSKVAQEKRYDLKHNSDKLKNTETNVTPPISRESFERNFSLNTEAARDTSGAYMHQVLQK